MEADTISVNPDSPLPLRAIWEFGGKTGDGPFKWEVEFQSRESALSFVIDLRRMAIGLEEAAWRKWPSIESCATVALSGGVSVGGAGAPPTNKKRGAG